MPVAVVSRLCESSGSPGSSLGTHYPTAKHQLQEPGQHGGWQGRQLDPNPVGRATMRQRAELGEGGFAIKLPPTWSCIGHAEHPSP